MHYWNQDNFEGLVRIAESLRDDPQLGPVARYCVLRSEGIRKSALAEVHQLVRFAEEWSVPVRRDAAERLLRIWYEHPEVHQLLPHPLREGFVRPTLEQWAGTEPDCAAALRWLGLVTGDRTALEKAVSLDNRDDVARGRLVAHLLQDVDHATHHLVEGCFIGDEDEANNTLNAAQALLNDAADPTRMERLQRWLTQLRQLLDDWIAFRVAPEGTFRDWCDRQGHKYDWPTIVYYDRGAS